MFNMHNNSTSQHPPASQRARSTLEKAKSNGFLVLLAIVVTILPTLNVHAAQFTGGIAPIYIPDTNPCTIVSGSDILDVDVSSTNGNSLGVISREDIHYSEQSSMDVTLTLPICSQVMEIRMRDTVLLEESDIGVDPPTMYYSEESDVNLGDGTHEVTVRLHYSNNHEGRSYPVEFSVRNPNNGYDVAVTHKLTVVGVKDIPGLNSAISFSDNELDNIFNKKIFDTFGPNNSTVINIDGKDRTFYGSSYNPINLTGNGQINFGWSFNIEVENYCDLEMSVNGAFTLDFVTDVNDIDNDGDTSETILTSVWRNSAGNEVDGPNVVADMPFWCKVPLPIVAVIKTENIFRTIRLAREAVQDMIVSLVGAEVGSMVDAFDCSAAGDGVSCLNLISSVDAGYRKLTINLALIPQKVIINIPYGNQHQSSPIGNGFALNPGDRIAIAASHRAQVCGSFYYGTFPNCGNTMLSPNGLPNSQVDDGIEYPRQRITRTPSQLPFPDANVGALFAHYQDDVLGVVTIPGGIYFPPMTIDTRISENILLNNLGQITTSPLSAEGGWLNFGMNEKFNAGYNVYGGGFYQVSIVWIP